MHASALRMFKQVEEWAAMEDMWREKFNLGKWMRKGGEFRRIVSEGYVSCILGDGGWR